ncbi:putative alcohol dehydrogenase, partial [Xylariales sp. AK1849]
FASNSIMAFENTQYLVRERGGHLEATNTAKPTITQPTEVTIRLKAIAVNPADIKMIDQGHRVTSWPLVPGLDGAGVVEAIGDGVKNLAIGDEVLAMFIGNQGGSYQRFAVVQEMMVAKKPAAWSFEDAATLGVCYFTAIIGLGIGLKTPLPFLEDGPRAGFEPSSVLILGGSSALGASTIQLLRLAVPDCLILTTSSPKHHGHITEALRADAAFDRNSPSLINDVKSASPGSRGVDAIIDTVGAGATQSQIFEAFDEDGPKRYAQVWTGDDEISVPSGVHSVMFRGADSPRLQGGNNIMLALQTLLKEDRYKLPLPVHKVGDGVDALEKGLDLMRNGISGEKLVVGI